MITLDRNITCCFSGHRPEKLRSDEATVRNWLNLAVDTAIEKGYKNFITGMERGRDLWAAETVIEHRKLHPDIKLIMVCAFEGMTKKWDQQWKNKFNELSDLADEVIHPSGNVVGAEAYAIKMEWMLNHASLLFVVYERVPGGTRIVIEYAKTQNMKICPMIPIPLHLDDRIKRHYVSIESLKYAVTDVETRGERTIIDITLKDQFIQLYQTHIKRKGADALLDLLENKSNFFKDPASSRYHLAYPGGLVEHSINVYKRLHWLCEVEDKFNLPFQMPSEESIAIVGLLHDICKADTYIEHRETIRDYDKHLVATTRNGGHLESIYSDEQGDFVLKEQVTYTKEDPFPFGHGEKSVLLITKFMQLTEEEIFAIRYHMSSWNPEEKNRASSIFETYEFALLTHMADEFATFVDEV